MTHAAFVQRISQQVRAAQGNVCANCQLPHEQMVQRHKSDKRVWRLYASDDVMWTQAQLGYLVLCWRDGDKSNFAAANLWALCSVCSKNTDGIQTVRVERQTEMWE